MNALGQGLMQGLRRVDWQLSWVEHENPTGGRTYQAVADREDVHLCAEGRDLTEALARLWQLCNQDSLSRQREGELAA
jgi:hypothetical protein